MTQAIQKVEATTLARSEDELSIEEVVEQVRKVQQVMHSVMRSGEHYGVIPGTGDKAKPTLLKPGAEKLCLLFRLDPQYTIEKIWDGSHLTVESTCTLFHIASGQRRGSGMGSCSTRESKYAWRKASRACPKCGSEAIIRGREEYGGGWLCFAKKGGCGAKFKKGDDSIEKQETGRTPNPDIADTYNTVLKMANKRSLVAAVLNVTAASDIFTQDLEDLEQHAPVHVEEVAPQPIAPGDPDEPGKIYADPPELVTVLQDAEALIGAGKYSAARDLLGRKGDRQHRPGSFPELHNKAFAADQMSEAYRRELGKFWARLNRVVEKHEFKAAAESNAKLQQARDDVTAAFIDPPDGEEDAAQ